MSVTRREFLTAASAGGVGLLAAGAAITAARGERNEGMLKLASQEGRIPGDSLKERVDRMVEWKMQGIEFGGGGLPDRVDEIEKALDGSGIEVAAICAGFQGCIISDQEAERQKCIDTMKPLLEAAGIIGARGVILVPAFNGQTQLSNADARPILIDLLKQLGEYAVGVSSRVLLEPLNRGECFFLRQLADGAAICRDVDSPGVALMGDFYHINIEETSDLGAFLSGGAYVRHVHLASRRRVLPGQDERSFVSGFRGLKLIGYQDHCSFECGCDGDPMVEIPKSLDFLRRQWEEATVPVEVADV